MDDLTARYYENNAVELTKRYNSVESPLSSLVPILFKPGEKVLDVGCGSGRDVSHLLEMGYDAYGLEPSANFRELAVQQYPGLSGKIVKGLLPHRIPKDLGAFDNIILSAVIMHIPDNELFESAFALRSILKKGGLIVISHCTSRDDELLENRDNGGRLFILRSSEQIQLLFEGVGFVKRHCFKSNDSINRSRTLWDTLVLEYTGDLRSESIDRIEHVINSDRKTATYKLALLRSLCDIAQTTPYCASWTSSGRVKIPIKYISGKWIEYYLPLISSKTFIPNNRGENPDSQKPIAFRKLLTELSNTYSQAEGLAQFIDDRDKGKFTAEVGLIYNETVKKINRTIIEGPVKYTSGNCFDYISEDKTIIMEGALWREMVLLGHWIEDSLVLKWAQLINTFSKTTAEVPVHQILDIMLNKPEMERRVSPARRTYEGQTELSCVWSNKPIIKKNLAVDHAIPFSIRHDNSLWNLLPTDSKVNSDKSDKLPKESLLRRQRDAIIHNWQLLFSSQKNLFSAEACRFLGTAELPQQTWEIDLYSHFFETIEYTASRRGIERWGC